MKKHTFHLGDIHLGDIGLRRPSSVSGGLPPSRGHPSRATFLRLGDIRLGAIRLRDWEGQDEWHRRMSLGRKAMKTEDPSVQAFPPRAIRLRHPSVPPVSWMSVSAFRLGVIRLGSSVSGSSVSGHPSRGQPTSEINIINFNQPSHGTSTNYYTLIH